jgi:hypothetical protein
MIVASRRSKVVHVTTIARRVSFEVACSGVRDASFLGFRTRTRTRTRFRAFEYEYEYHFIEYEYDF